MEPWGQARADWQAALIASYVVNSQLKSEDQLPMQAFLLRFSASIGSPAPAAADSAAPGADRTAATAGAAGSQAAPGTTEPTEDEGAMRANWLAALQAQYGGEIVHEPAEA